MEIGVYTPQQLHGHQRVQTELPRHAVRQDAGRLDVQDGAQLERQILLQELMARLQRRSGNRLYQVLQCHGAGTRALGRRQGLGGLLYDTGSWDDLRGAARVDPVTLAVEGVRWQYHAL